MSARGVGLLAAFAGATAAGWACSDGDDQRSADQTESGATGGAAGELGGRGDSGAGDRGGYGAGGAVPAGAAGQTSAGGSNTGSGGQTAACGDGVVQGDEDCDGEQFAAGVSCSAFGFDTGTPSCNDDCTAAAEGCRGTERCYDGRDNDGDALIDCLDEADCGPACSDPCSEVPVLTDPGSVFGTTEGSADLSSASCSASPSGGELVYQVSAEAAGMLDVELGGVELLTVSVRTSCAEPATELGCAMGRLSVPVAAGDRLYVMVEGLSEVDAGQFTLDVASRPATVCGDGLLDPGEQCEDENRNPGDGCDPNCALESTESEPNDDVASADPFVDPYFAEIRPAGDEDVVAVEVAQGPASLRVSTYNVGIGMCGLELMDSYLEVLDTDGTTVLIADDDGGDGFCASASTFALPAGTYYVRVRASDAASPGLEIFPYRLGLSVDVCGNGLVAAGEECDDGNTESFDGCSAVCRLEPAS